ncbi:hypothetical protein SNEBB_000572 [Seison nebaliae]|nr:hypothetical protein SNEBB_000572 [Seison nebaliae]
MFSQKKSGISFDDEDLMDDDFIDSSYDDFEMKDDSMKTNMESFDYFQSKLKGIGLDFGGRQTYCVTTDDIELFENKLLSLVQDKENFNEELFRNGMIDFLQNDLSFKMSLISMNEKNGEEIQEMSPLFHYLLNIPKSLWKNNIIEILLKRFDEDSDGKDTLILGEFYQINNLILAVFLSSTFSTEKNSDLFKRFSFSISKYPVQQQCDMIPKLVKLFPSPQYGMELNDFLSEKLKENENFFISPVTECMRRIEVNESLLDKVWKKTFGRMKELWNGNDEENLKEKDIISESDMIVDDSTFIEDGKGNSEFNFLINEALPNCLSIASRSSYGISMIYDDFTQLFNDYFDKIFRRDLVEIQEENLHKFIFQNWDHSTKERERYLLTYNDEYKRMKEFYGIFSRNQMNSFPINLVNSSTDFKENLLNERNVQLSTQLNRSFFCDSQLENKFYEILVRRLNDHSNQLTIFDIFMLFILFDHRHNVKYLLNCFIDERCSRDNIEGTFQILLRFANYGKSMISFDIFIELINYSMTLSKYDCAILFYAIGINRNKEIKNDLFYQFIINSLKMNCGRHDFLLLLLECIYSSDIHLPSNIFNLFHFSVGTIKDRIIFRQIIRRKSINLPSFFATLIFFTLYEEETTGGQLMMLKRMETFLVDETKEEETFSEILVYFSLLLYLGVDEKNRNSTKLSTTLNDSTMLNIEDISSINANENHQRKTQNKYDKKIQKMFSETDDSDDDDDDNDNDDDDTNLLTINKLANKSVGDVMELFEEDSSNNHFRMNILNCISKVNCAGYLDLYYRWMERLVKEFCVDKKQLQDRKWIDEQFGMDLSPSDYLQKFIFSSNGMRKKKKKENKSVIYLRDRESFPLNELIQLIVIFMRCPSHSGNCQMESFQPPLNVIHEQFISSSITSTTFEFYMNMLFTYTNISMEYFNFSMSRLAEEMKDDHLNHNSTNTLNHIHNCLLMIGYHLYISQFSNYHLPILNHKQLTSKMTVALLRKQHEPLNQKHLAIVTGNSSSVFTSNRIIRIYQLYSFSIHYHLTVYDILTSMIDIDEISIISSSSSTTTTDQLSLMSNRFSLTTTTTTLSQIHSPKINCDVNDYLYLFERYFSIFHQLVESKKLKRTNPFHSVYREEELWKHLQRTAPYLYSNYLLLNGNVQEMADDQIRNRTKSFLANIWILFTHLIIYRFQEEDMVEIDFFLKIFQKQKLTEINSSRRSSNTQNKNQNKSKVREYSNILQNLFNDETKLLEKSVDHILLFFQFLRSFQSITINYLESMENKNKNFDKNIHQMIYDQINEMIRHFLLDFLTTCKHINTIRPELEKIIQLYFSVVPQPILEIKRWISDYLEAFLNSAPSQVADSNKLIASLTTVTFPSFYGYLMQHFFNYSQTNHKVTHLEWKERCLVVSDFLRLSKTLLDLPVVINKLFTFIRKFLNLLKKFYLKSLDELFQSETEDVMIEHVNIINSILTTLHQHCDHVKERQQRTLLRKIPAMQQQFSEFFFAFKNTFAKNDYGHLVKTIK